MATDDTSAPTYFRFPDLTVCSVQLPSGGWIMWDWTGTTGCWHAKTDEERNAIKDAERLAFEPAQATN